jgi:hypothetical protein
MTSALAGWCIGSNNLTVADRYIRGPKTHEENSMILTLGIAFTQARHGGANGLRNSTSIKGKTA